MKIVESESDEFLNVASKLEHLQTYLTTLKQSFKDFHTSFALEKTRTKDMLDYMGKQWEELSENIKEKQELENLVKV